MKQKGQIKKCTKCCSALTILSQRQNCTCAYILIYKSEKL